MEERKEEGQRTPAPHELWETAGLEKAEGRKGSGDSLLFELCVLWFQSQHTHPGLAIYILSISMQAEAGCSCFHHCIHYGDTALKRVCLLVSGFPHLYLGNLDVLSKIEYCCIVA